MNGKSVQQGNPHAGNVVRRVTFKWCVGLESEWEKSKPINKNQLRRVMRYFSEW